MAHSDVLIVIAECGVALAGFASLISVFGSSSETLDFTRLFGMVKNSITAAGFALLPFAPAALGASDAIVWRGSAVLLLVVHLTSVAQSWAQLARLRRAGVLRPVRVSYYSYPVGVLSILLAFAATLPSDPARASGIYVCALLAILSIAGALFVSVFGSFIRGRIRRHVEQE